MKLGGLVEQVSGSFIPGLCREHEPQGGECFVEASEVHQGAGVVGADIGTLRGVLEPLFVEGQSVLKTPLLGEHIAELEVGVDVVFIMAQGRLVVRPGHLVDPLVLGH